MKSILQLVFSWPVITGYNIYIYVCMYIYIYCIHRATDPVSLQRHLYKDEAGEPDRLEASKERQSKRDAGIPRLRNQLATRYLPVCYGKLFIYSLFMISYLLNMVIFHSCVQLPEGTSEKNIGNGGD